MADDLTKRGHQLRILAFVFLKRVAIHRVSTIYENLAIPETIDRSGLA